MWNYAVTAQKATTVSHSVVGRFTSPKDLNLIISKCTRLEIQLLAAEGLVPLLEIGIYGRIASLQLLRLPGETQDMILVTTEKHKFCVLEYKNGEIVTRATGDLHDIHGKPADIGQVVTIDPEARCVAMHLYDGSMKILPIDGKTGSFKDTFNVRVEELQLIDVKFLAGCKEPTYALLYQDSKEARHVKTYELDMKTKDIKDGNWCINNVDRGASMLVPLSMGGVLVIGEQSITYHSGGNVLKSVRMRPAIINAVGKIDQTRYFLGDHKGNLIVLVLETDSSNNVTDIKFDVLGETSIASTISYLDNNVIFVGSRFGDSQLIKLHTEKVNGTNIEVLDRYDNLGPIIDFCVMDLDRQGQGQIVACSGAFKDGSLRVIRNGIGINEQAAVELPGIKGIWTLRTPEHPEHDKYIVLSFVQETRILAFTNEELEETEIAGFQADEQTVFAGNVAGGQLLQITRQGVFLVDAGSLQLISKWAPADNGRITVASCNGNQILLGVGGGHLVYLEIQGTQITLISQKTLEHEISCVNITPLGNRNDANVCAVGMWTDISVRLYSIPKLELLQNEKLGGEILPRSVLLASLEGVNYLFCGLGDGHLFSFVLGETALEHRKKVSLGTQPLMLRLFTTKGQVSVFAASDRPTVIYSSNKKLLYSNVNLRDVTTICPFNSSSFPDSLAIANESMLTIGSIDDIQKLHVRTIPLKEMARRIAHQPKTNSLGVLTVSTVTSSSGEEGDSGFFHLFNDQTFEKTDTYPLEAAESPCSIIATTFADDTEEYFVIGTAFIVPTEPEPTRGRIIVAQAADGKIKVVNELEVKGPVHSLASINGKLLASVGSKITIYSWSVVKEGSNKQLAFECGHAGQVIPLYLASRGDFVIVGDLMRSISLYLYKHNGQQPTLEEIAKDHSCNWMSSVEALDDDTYIGSENNMNFFTVKRRSEAATDEERSKLDVCGRFHIGEFVNRFRHGSLLMRMAESEYNFKTLLYGTVSGSIGVVASIPQDLFELLSKVQSKLATVIKGVGGFSHDHWRSFTTERVVIPSSGFIDGDLVEAFLDLKSDKMRQIAKECDIPVEELVKKIESLQRALH